MCSLKHRMIKYIYNEYRCLLLKVYKFNDPCNWFMGRRIFIIFNLRESTSTSDVTRSKLKYFIFYITYMYVIFSLSPPLSLSLPFSRSLSLCLPLVACWFKPLVQTSDDYWQGSPPLPPRPPSTQNFNCQKIIMDTNRLGTIMSCKPTQKNSLFYSS